MLQDDPEFLPDFNLLPQDFDRMDAAFGLLEEAQHSVLSPHHSQRTSVGTASIHDIGGLVIPPSASSYGTGPLGGPNGFSSHGDSNAGLRTHIGGLDDDLGLVIDEDGNIQILDGEVHHTPVPLQRDARTRMGSPSSGMRGQDGLGQIGDDYVSLLLPLR